MIMLAPPPPPYSPPDDYKFNLEGYNRSDLSFKRVYHLMHKDYIDDINLEGKVTEETYEAFVKNKKEYKPDNRNWYNSYTDFSPGRDLNKVFNDYKYVLYTKDNSRVIGCHYNGAMRFLVEVDENYQVCGLINTLDSKGSITRKYKKYNDKMEGLYVSYENNVLKIKGEARDGHFSGIWSYYKDGELDFVTYYDDKGYRVKDITFFTGVTEAEVKQFTKSCLEKNQEFNAYPSVINEYVKSKKCGISAEYHRNGHIKRYVSYKDGKKHGCYQQFDESGKLIESLNYCDDIYHGQQITYERETRHQTLSTWCSPSVKEYLLTQ